MKDYIYPIVLTLGILLFLFLVNYTRNRKYLKALRAKIEEDFGKNPSDDKKDIKIVSSLYENTKMGEAYIDDITFNDLNLNAVFKLFDHNSSIIGTQYFYKMLRTPIFEHSYHKRQREIREYLIKNIDNTKNMKFEFAKFGNLKRDVLDIIINGIEYERYKDLKYPVYIFAFTIPIAIIAAIFLKKNSFFLIIIIVILAGVVSAKMKKATEGKIIDVGNLSSILNLSKNIEKYNCSVLEDEMKEIVKLNIELSPIRRVSGTFGEKGANVEMEMAYEMQELLTMRRGRKFFKIVQLVNEKKEEILKLYELLGYIEANISIASLYLSVNGCDVEFSEDKFDLEAENLYHPLLNIDTQVPVSFNFDSESVLVTGSNASGKSTFLRNVGISNVMAMTMGFVLADSYKSSMLYLQSAINLEDSIEKGVSYFLSETLAIKRMIEPFSVPKLLILDEIFKGTNTIDRIAAAYSTLKYISRDNKVFAATHDIELTKLLEDYFSNYHFEEEILENDIKFDYKLKKGPAISRNAIEILKIKGYPEEIIENSYSLSRKLEEEKK
ncbi:MutS domain V [Anaerosphaera aminiphila DSM 21120]|uniref:MutS domain V n=1 Tax=Anaerosphaera aminiphila DSM 21120 TaxID=1120995 RepID=A0A1M5QUX6_9FIRM|nr:hypothetical protein [Anaerosphaera aminiphila]SHH17902.1 MutS domain V [Anaerosphaera aminiphila DSM 21120]